MVCSNVTLIAIRILFTLISYSKTVCKDAFHYEKSKMNNIMIFKKNS